MTQDYVYSENVNYFSIFLVFEMNNFNKKCNYILLYTLLSAHISHNYDLHLLNDSL